MNADAGRVIIQERMICLSIDLSRYSLFFPCLRFCHSRNRPIQNIPPIAMCVELTGNPSALAIITVIAAESATQYALTWLSFVISFQTVFMRVLPYTPSHTASPSAPIHIIQTGIPALPVATEPRDTVS